MNMIKWRRIKKIEMFFDDGTTKSMTLPKCIRGEITIRVRQKIE